MHAYLTETPLRKILPPIIYNRYFKNNILVNDWTGVELLMAIAQNNSQKYELTMLEVKGVKDIGDKIKLDTDCGSFEVAVEDETKERILKYDRHAQAAIVKHPDGNYYIIVDAAATEREAKAGLNSNLAMDIIETLDIKTPGKFKQLYSESMMLYRTMH